MTVSTTDSVVEYVSGGPAYPIPYRFLQDADIEAVLVKQDGTSETLTGAQYTLTGAGTQSGGTLTSSYAAGYLATPGASLTISRVMDPVQPTDLRNQGRFLAETHESVFDRLTMLIQQGFAGIARALKRPVGKSYFDAEGRRIANVQDPAEDDDATNKGWVTNLIAQILQTGQGPINNAANVIMVGANGFIGVVQDLAAMGNSLKGAAMLAYRNRTVAQKLSEHLSGADAGTVGDGATLNDVALAALALEARTAPLSSYIGSGTYNTSVLNLTGTQPFVMHGEGRQFTTFNKAGGVNLLNFEGLDGLSLTDFTVRMNHTLASNGHAIVLIDQPNSRVKNVDVKGFAGVGTGVLAYSSDANVRRRNIALEDITFEGDFANSSNTNGTLIENGVYCRQSGIFVDGAKEFAVEYKNNTRYSLVSDVISVNSGYALGYGQTTVGDIGVSGCVATGIIGFGCNVGIVVGDGDQNVFSGAMLNCSGTTGANKRGISTATNADQNMFVGILTAGDMLEPVRWDSNRNYGQVASHDTAANIVSITAGSAKNVTEIAHPGARISILNSILNSSGNAISGSNANPVYCHATGEYVGTLSSRWTYRHAASGASPLSAARHVLEGAGDTSYSVVHDGAGSCGLLVTSTGKNASLLYNATAGTWQLGDSTANVLFSSTFVRPSNDNAMALGGASNRYSTVYAGTGSINTSDGRLKEDVRSLSEAERAVATRIKGLIRAFRFTESIEAKGDAARVHFGVIAQDVQAAFEAEGLNPFEYALLCYDEWDEQAEELDEAGGIVREYRAAGSRYGIRYEELLAFVISVM